MWKSTRLWIFTIPKPLDKSLHNTHCHSGVCDPSQTFIKLTRIQYSHPNLVTTLRIPSNKAVHACRSSQYKFTCESLLDYASSSFLRSLDKSLHTNHCHCGVCYAWHTFIRLARIHYSHRNFVTTLRRPSNKALHACRSSQYKFTCECLLDYASSPFLRSLDKSLRTTHYHCGVCYAWQTFIRLTRIQYSHPNFVTTIRIPSNKTVHACRSSQ